MKEDARGKVVELRGRKIPRNAKGDPAFTWLMNDYWDPRYLEEWDAYHDDEATKAACILSQFTPAEVCAMVNRYIYQTEYQRTVHRQRARDEAAALAPLKDKLMEMFGVSHLKATDAQIAEAVAVLKKEKKI